MKQTFFILTTLLTTLTMNAQNGPCIVPGRGYFRIHTGTSGLFGAFAHNHLIEAQKIEGCASLDSKDLTRSSIKLTFAASGVRVMDPGESAKDRATVQQTMETEVLRVAQFPKITFESTGVELGAASGQIKVRGNLTIRDKMQPVTIGMTFARLGDGTYQAMGKYNFKQSTFGIKPIQLAGGTIKVKDDMETEFEVFLK